MLDSWFDACAYLMPFGKNSCLTALRHFPRWHQLACASLNGICAGICSILLFISSPKLTSPYFCFFHSLLVLTNSVHLPSAPKRLTVRARFARLWTASPLTYGARWNKRRTPGEGFPWLSSGTVSLNNFVKILVCTGFCVDTESATVWAPKGRVWHLSVSFLAKFCIA